MMWNNISECCLHNQINYLQKVSYKTELILCMVNVSVAIEVTRTACSMDLEEK